MEKHVDAEVGSTPVYEASEDRKNDRGTTAGAILGEDVAAEYGYVTRG